VLERSLFKLIDFLVPVSISILCILFKNSCATFPNDCDEQSSWVRIDDVGHLQIWRGQLSYRFLLNLYESMGKSSVNMENVISSQLEIVMSGCDGRTDDYNSTLHLNWNLLIASRIPLDSNISNTIHYMRHYFLVDPFIVHIHFHDVRVSHTCKFGCLQVEVPK